MPTEAKTIITIWFFKRKHYPDGLLNKHKARLCVHGGQQTWGQDYWKTYAPLVTCKLIGSWGRRSMAVAGEVTRHGRAHPYSWLITIVSLRSKKSEE
jgi:hypothetical protein